MIAIKLIFFTADIPGAPNNVQVTNVTSTSITLTWSPPLIAETFELIIYSYKINCSTGSYSKRSNTAKTTDSLNATLSNLQPSTSYNCCLAVNSAHGRGKLSCLKVPTCESQISNIIIIIIYS